MHAQAMNDVQQAALAEQRLAEEERKQADESRKRASDQATVTVEIRNILDRQHKDQLIDRTKSWLLPPDFAETPYRAQNIRENGTSIWIFQRPEFVTWRDSPWSIRPGKSDKVMGENLLWIYGNPGCGKTVLASTILEELEHPTQSTASLTPQVCYFFFTSGNPKTSASTAAYRSVLTQVIHNHRDDEDLLDKFSYIMDNSGSSGSPMASSGDLESLFRLCLQHIPVYLLLDGIDECEDVKSLIDVLLWISAYSSTKVLVFGRTNIPNMNRFFPQSLRLVMDRLAITQDIDIFLKSQMKMLIEEEFLPLESNITELVSCLCKGADGMFLWARLMITYLNSPALTPLQRTRTIRDVTLPEGLGQMYQRIADLIVKTSRAQLNLAQHVLTWAIYSIDPLTVEELQDVLTFKDAGIHGHQFKDFQETISVVCAGLVECYAPSEDQYGGQKFVVRCIHISVKEHFTPGPSTGDKLQLRLAAGPIANLALMDLCLQYLRHFMPPVQPGNMALPDTEPGPFAGYASRNWHFHMYNIFSDQSIEKYLETPEFYEMAIPAIENVTSFMGNTTAVRSWIERLYSWLSQANCTQPDMQTLHSASLIATLADKILHKSHLRAALQQLASTLQDFAPDIHRLTVEWGSQLSDIPALIWDEIPAFVHSRFLGASADTILTSLGPTPPNVPGCSTKAICTISRTSSNNQMTGVLTIWPPKIYEDAWENPLVNIHLLEKETCSGWIARYEVWEHGDKQRKVIDLPIPICETEVLLLLRQAYRLKDTGDTWGVSFPLAIGHSLSSLLILRTLYSFQSDRSGSKHILQSVVIPLDQEKELQRLWSGNMRLIPTDWYTYEFSFSSNDQYLLFRDRYQNIKSHASFFACFDVGIPTTIVILEIKSERGLAVQMINKQTIPDKRRIMQATFHQSNSFLALNYGREIEAWQFLRNRTKQLCSFPNDIVDMAFSSCGDFLIAKASESPSVIPLPEDLRLNASRNPESIIEPLEDINQVEQMSTSRDLQPQMQIISPFRPGQILHTPVAIPSSSSSSGTPTSLMIFRSGSSVTIDLSHADENNQSSTQSFQITSLPDWQGMQHTTPTVIVPKTDQTSIKVILDKTSEDEYSLSKPTDTRLPVMISRKISAVRWSAPRSVGAYDLELILNPVEDAGGNSTGKEDGESIHVMKRSLSVGNSINMLDDEDQMSESGKRRRME